MSASPGLFKLFPRFKSQPGERRVRKTVVVDTDTGLTGNRINATANATDTPEWVMETMAGLAWLA